MTNTNVTLDCGNIGTRQVVVATRNEKKARAVAVNVMRAIRPELTTVRAVAACGCYCGGIVYDVNGREVR